MVVTFVFNVRNINVNLLGGTYQRDIEKKCNKFCTPFLGSLTLSEILAMSEPVCLGTRQ